MTLAKTCSRCQTAFGCSAATGTCWCMDYPALMPVPESGTADCVCPACLTQMTQDVINQTIDTVAIHAAAPQAAIACSDQQLIEGLDYQVNALGHWVFSRWFLLRRGTCCGNGCLNCPYGHINVTANSRPNRNA